MGLPGSVPRLRSAVVVVDVGVVVGDRPEAVVDVAHGVQGVHREYDGDAVLLRSRRAQEIHGTTVAVSDTSHRPQSIGRSLITWRHCTCRSVVNACSRGSIWSVKGSTQSSPLMQ